MRREKSEAGPPEFIIDAMDIDTYPQAALGYRAWRVKGDGKALMAAHVEEVWKPGLMGARCHIREEHDPPYPGCRCGVHAYYTLQRAKKERPLPDSVVGIIAGCGTLECHHHGWRAHEAQIIALLARKGHYDQDRVLGALYNVPVFTDAKAMEKYALKYAAPIPTALRPSAPPWWRNTETSSRRLSWGLRFFGLYVAFMIAMLIAEVAGISDTLDAYLKVGIGTILETGAFVFILLALTSGFFDGLYRFQLRQRYQQSRSDTEKDD